MYHRQAACLLGSPRLSAGQFVEVADGRGQQVEERAQDGTEVTVTIQIGGNGRGIAVIGLDAHLTPAGLPQDGIAILAQDFDLRSVAIGVDGGSDKAAWVFPEVFVHGHTKGADGISWGAILKDDAGHHFFVAGGAGRAVIMVVLLLPLHQVYFCGSCPFFALSVQEDDRIALLWQVSSLDIAHVVVAFDIVITDDESIAFFGRKPFDSSLLVGFVGG